MSIFSRLFGTVAPQSAKSTFVNDRNAVWVYVKCKKCGEIIPLRLRKTDEITRDCDGVCTADKAVFFVRKQVMGTNPRCFNRIDLFLQFDVNYNVIASEVKGGELVSREEYQGC